MKRIAMFVGIITIFLFGNLFNNVVLPQESKFPSKAIKLMIGIAPGGSADLPVRALAKAAEKYLGQSIACFNVPGGGGTRAMGSILYEKPDGYVLSTIFRGCLITANTEKLDFSPVKSFTPVIQVQAMPVPFLVKKEAEWKTWPEFVKWARKEKEGVPVAVSGARGNEWLVLTQIGKKENIKFISVPCAGPGESMSAILGGHVVANTNNSGILYAKSGGTLRLLTLFSVERLKDFPDIPSAKDIYGEAGTGFLMGGYTGLVAPKGLPEPSLGILYDAFNKAKEDQEFRSMCDKFAVFPSRRNQREFASILEKENEMIKAYLGEAETK
jgi:tripartite-type tricarboxylate transporter receptor subunit TctC